IFDTFSPEELGIDIRLFHEVFYCTRCSSPASSQTCPHDDNYRINISGTGVRELLRHGFLPPKEIVRPESARIAMQGVQPKGTDENNEATLPVGKTISSIFPYYREHYTVGGMKRKNPINFEQLTIEDLELAIRDARENADKIYRDIYAEFSYVTDLNRHVQPAWKVEANEAMERQQEMVIADLEEKVKQAPESASD